MGHPSSFHFTNLFDVIKTRGFKGSGADRHHQNICIVDLDRTFFFSTQIPTKATPAPLLRRIYKAARYWISMNIAKLLDSFLLCPDVEVVEPSLPERMRDRCGVQSKTWGPPGLATVARPGNAGAFQTPDVPELECLHGSGDSCPLRFRDQQMYVLGHNDISQNYQSISATHTFQNLQKQAAAQCIAQQRLAVIAAEREKVKIPRAVSTVKIFGHRWRVEQLGYVCR